MLRYTIDIDPLELAEEISNTASYEEVKDFILELDSNMQDSTFTEDIIKALLRSVLPELDRPDRVELMKEIDNIAVSIR